MKDLTSDLDDKVLKGLQHKIDEANAEASNAKEQLAKKQEELANLAKERDDVKLKYEGKVAELDSKVNELEKLKTEVFDLKKTITLNIDEINKSTGETNTLKAQIEDLNKKNEEITNSLTEKDSKIKELNDALAEKDNIIDAQNAKIEKAETELTALQPVAPTTYTSEDRLTCPSCGAVGKDLKAEEDKSKVLSYVGHTPMYAKRNVCKKCGYIF